MKKSGWVLVALVFFSSCVISTDNNSGEVRKLLDKDEEFSDYSIEYGLSEAFIRYADSAAVLLKPDMMPIKGGLSIERYYSRLEDENMKLSWVPLDATISRSRELGYTYGIWELETPDTTRQGTYITVWKKNSQGDWKYVLDSGNEGLGYVPETGTN